MIDTKTILGTDAMNQSRITINENFTVCKNAINEMSAYFSNGNMGTDSTPIIGRSLNINGTTQINDNGLLTTKNIAINDYVTFDAIAKTVTFKGADSDSEDVVFTFDDIAALKALLTSSN